MIALLRAEMRKNWKTRKLIVIVLSFLSFMGCSYLFAQNRDKQYHQMESYSLMSENGVASGNYEEMKSKLQNTPEKEISKSYREKYNLWKAVATSCYDYSMLRQAPEYYGMDTITKAMLKKEKALVKLMSSKHYKNEFSSGGRSLQDVKNSIAYYSYLREHKLPMYTSPYQPNLFNFLMQIFQNESIILLIMISAFFMIDQLCHDFDYGTYKTIYTIPLKRSKVMGAKILSCLCMNVMAFIIAFLLFAMVPISQHGFGYVLFPYLINQQMIMFLPLFFKTMVLMLIVLLVYMGICAILANVLKNTTNAMLSMTGIMLVVYMSIHFFGIRIPIVSWLPLYYLYPFDIITGSFDYPYFVCILIAVLSLAALYFLYHKKLTDIDLKGSEGL